MVVFILLGLLVFFAAIGVPLAFAIGASSVSFLAIDAPQFLMILPQKLWGGAYSELLIALPLFMLAGELMNSGGITDRIIRFCLHLVRPIHGGLGEVNVVASMIFGGITGSSVADTSALGSILIPAMEKNGYPKSAASGITVASSTMGMIIPPSIPMIVYAMISGASIGGLFIAGLVPGVTDRRFANRFGVHHFQKKGVAPRQRKASLGSIPQGFLLWPSRFDYACADRAVGFLWYRNGYRIGGHCGGLCAPPWISGVQRADLETGLACLEECLQVFRFHYAHRCHHLHLHLDFIHVPSSPAHPGIFPRAERSLLEHWADVRVDYPDLRYVHRRCAGHHIIDPHPVPRDDSFGLFPAAVWRDDDHRPCRRLVTPPIGMCLNACHRINKMPILDIFRGAVPYIICNLLVLIAVTLIPALTTWLPTLIRY